MVSQTIIIGMFTFDDGKRPFLISWFPVLTERGSSQSTNKAFYETEMENSKKIPL